MPEEPESWDGVKNGRGGECTPCMQRNVILPEKDFLIFGKEDCLYLNVFTPQNQGCNSIDIFLGPVSGPEPCPSHVWSFE